jgi:hypothetical protein
MRSIDRLPTGKLTGLFHADGPHLRCASSPVRASFPTGKPDRGLFHDRPGIGHADGAESAVALTVGVHEEGFEDVVVFDATSGAEHDGFKGGVDDIDGHAGNSSEPLVEASQQ